jgi:hypothetical protein
VALNCPGALLPPQGALSFFGFLHCFNDLDFRALDARTIQATKTLSCCPNQGGIMNSLTKAIVAGASALALTATAASAAIVCNDEGECWHAKRSDFKPEHRLHVYPDNWKWGSKEHYRWREHEGHGYWRGGSWVEIK